MKFKSRPAGMRSLGGKPVADPGFPRGGGANPQGGDANQIFGQKFPENCMRTHPGAPLDPPMEAVSEAHIESSKLWPKISWFFGFEIG